MQPLLVLLLAFLAPLNASCGSNAPVRKILRIAKSEIPQKTPRTERRPKQEQEPSTPEVEIPPPSHIPDGHPRLYFSQADLQSLQLQASGTHAPLSRRIQGFGDFGIKKKKKNFLQHILIISSFYQFFFIIIIIIWDNLVH